MKIGTRITITTVILVMITLGLYGLLSVRARRAELESDLERQTELVGNAMAVALEALLPRNMGVEELGRTVAGWQKAEPGFQLAFIDLLHGGQPGFVVQEDHGAPHPADAGDGRSYAPPPSDPTRSARLARLKVEEQPVGDHVTVDGRHVYALTVPIRDNTNNNKLVAAIEVTRDEADVEAALADSQKAALVAVAGLAVMLALLVWLSTNATISNPLKRLVEAIDDVTHGDLGRVILRERDDEVGDLAERFNEMTGSFREAREEILQGVDAKLALETRLRHS